MGIIRKTESIKLLLTEFHKKKVAVSVTDLIKRLDSKINKSTIYRVLEKLEEDGVLHSFLDKYGIKWYAKCVACNHKEHYDAHPHFQCVSCGKIDCISMDLSIPKIPNREVFVAQTLIQGKCESCIS
ncbi:MAG: transcriptional repressor [Flavobacteriaceae bacterium]